VPLELAIPSVVQTTGYSCGPAALCAVLRYYGHKRLTERTLMRRAGTTSEGTEIAGLVRAAKSCGVEPWVWEKIRYDWLRDVLDLGHPTIAIVQAWSREPVDYSTTWDQGHYVVVTACDAHEVVCMDPSLRGARATVGADEWTARWHDLDEGRALENTVIVFPTGTVRRRRLGRCREMG
jgi:predicted double-glycine peptidase